MAKTNKTIVIFIIFTILLTQAFLFVNEKIQDNEIAFDEISHAIQSSSFIENQNLQMNDETKNAEEIQPLWSSKASYKSLFSGLYEIPDLIKVNPEIEYICDYKIKDSKTAIVVTDKNIYVRINGEIKKVSLNGIPSNSYFSSCEMTKYDGKYYIFVGTSYSGLFAKAIDDHKFYHFYIGLKRVFYTSEQSLLFETITSLYAKNQDLFIGYQSSKGVDLLDLISYYNMKNCDKCIYDIKKINFPLQDNLKQKIEKFFELDGKLYVYTNYGIYKYEQESFVLQKEFEDQQKVIDDSIKGIYVSSFAASSKNRIDKLIDIAKYCNLNTFVVDFKDDYGYLSYGSKLKLAKEMGSSRDLIDVDYLFSKAKENNIKIIARVTSFRDPIAYNYDNHKFAIWSKSKNEPWSGAKSIEKWIDPYNEEYLNYLIDVAKEIEGFGVYEIQFDYVRVPAEGKTSDIKYRYKTKNISHNVQLSSFFKKAKESLKLPVSADFFGYQCWYKISKHIGQDIYLSSMILDAIYPMYYPSHFSKGFYSKDLNQIQTAKLIYKDGIIRAFENSNYSIAIRPWIQAFKLDVKEDYVSYIKAQLEGVREAGINSYIFWNPSSDYDILYQVFK